MNKNKTCLDAQVELFLNNHTLKKKKKELKISPRQSGR